MTNINKAKNAEILIERIGRPGEWAVKKTLPPYKFYTCLIENVLEYGRNYGAPVKNILKDLREGLIKDRQFEIKLFDQKRGAMAQFALVSIITWMFLFICQKTIEVDIPIFYKKMMILLQFSGVIIYFAGDHFLKKRLFCLWPPYFFTLSTLKVLAQAGMPLQTILQKGRPDRLVKASPLASVHKSLESLIDDWQSKGIPVQERLKDLLEEVWFLQQMRFGVFLKISTLMKFSCLALFFLSAYFLYLYGLFGFFLK